MTPRRLAFRLFAAALAFAFGPALGQSAALGQSNEWSVISRPSSGSPEVIGGAAHGCLAGGVELPIDGAGYEAIRLSRHRYFGHPALVAYIERLGQRAHAEGLPVFYVGDMAQARGGPLPYGHASHQSGIDADIWLDLRPKTWLSPAAREEVELPSMLLANHRGIDPHRFGPGQVELLRLAASDPVVDRIFVNPFIKDALCRGIDGAARGDRSWLGRLRPWFGHDEHFHVRLHCPADSPLCEQQRPAPPGDGCGAELASWLHPRPAPATPSPAPKRHVVPPPACRSVLEAP